MPGASDILPGNPYPPESREHLGHEPRTVGGYRLLRRVGEGGMSTVYLSYDVPARRAVAVKLLADHLAGQQEFVNRFYREARLSRLVRHPNIVQGFAAGYDPEARKHYLVLEFIDGPSAHTALTRLGRIPVGTVVAIGINIARALTFLHSRNYVHRDVKPDNILLHPDGVAKLADLGLTKRLNDDTHLTSLNQGVGTSYYMPYEQALNAALVDGRSDIFALGATLYHLLTGQVPFQGSTHEEIIRVKQQSEFRPARDVNPETPAALDRILAKMLARDPLARYQSAKELVAALESTQLAGRIPSFTAGEPQPTTPPEHAQPPEAPTRADLPVKDADLDTPSEFAMRPVRPQINTAPGNPNESNPVQPRSTKPGGGFPLMLLVAFVLTGMFSSSGSRARVSDATENEPKAHLANPPHRPPQGLDGVELQ